MTDGEEKSVDEAWKRQARTEKGDAPPASPPHDLPPADFLTLVSVLATQAMMALGALPGEDGKEPPADLPHAKFLIDLVSVLEEKSKGNLRPDEESEIRRALHELRMLFVAKSR